MGALGPNEGVAAELADDGERDEEVLAPGTPGAEGAHPVEVQEALDLPGTATEAAPASNPSEQPPLPDFNS